MAVFRFITDGCCLRNLQFVESANTLVLADFQLGKGIITMSVGSKELNSVSFDWINAGTESSCAKKNTPLSK